MPVSTPPPSSRLRTKRTYSKPSAETWQEIVDLYSGGGFTLQELARRYGVSVRAIQIHVSAAKPAPALAGATAAPLPSLSTLAMSAGKLSEKAHTALIENTKASAYNDATAIQALIRQAVDQIIAAPGALPPTATVRACDQAAVTLERTHKVRRLILGMGKEDDAADRPLPELPIRELTQAEVEAIRQGQADEEAALAGRHPANAIPYDEVLNDHEIVIE